VQARHITPYGLAECTWKIEDGKIDLNVIIPPNTTALVILPGSEKQEVGSGKWHWSIPYQDPDARGPFTVDDLAGDIMSDAVARDTIMDVLVSAGAPEFLRNIIFDERNLTLRQSLRMLPNYDSAVKTMNDALQSIK
jgi:alpha-L-rhamnosidase